MRKTFMFIMALAFAIPELFSQADFRSGYIIKNNGDSLPGLIEYKGIRADARLCTFKTDEKSSRQSFTPDDVKAYRFADDRMYVARKVEIGGKTEVLFLEFLFNGDVDVFYFHDENGEHYLVDAGEGKLYELKNENRQIEVNGVTRIQKSKEYIGTLKYTFRQSPAVSKKVETMNLGAKSLINISREYQNEVAHNEGIVYARKVPPFKAGFGAMIGFSAQNIIQTKEIPYYFHDDPKNDFTYLEGSDFGNTYSPSVGLYLKVSMPQVSQKLFLQYEINFSHNKIHTLNEYTLAGNDMHYINTITLKQNFLTNTLALRYEYAKGKIRPSLQAGVFYSYSMITDYLRNEKIYYSWAPTTLYMDNDYTESPFSDYDFGYQLGLGVVFKIFNKKDLFLDFKYQRGLDFMKFYNKQFYTISIGYQLL
jgi:hypothetical protein